MVEAFRIDETQAGPPPEPANFVGTVRMQNLGKLGGTEEIEYFAVFFQAGSRTRPHIHHSDQILYFVRGSGFVAFPDEGERRVEEGGIVVIPAGLVHMHGATESEPICHLAVRAAGPTDWSPSVPDEWRQYAQ